MTFGDYNNPIVTLPFDLKKWSAELNYAGNGGVHEIRFSRKVSDKDIRVMEIDSMPGFRITWNYTGEQTGEEYLCRKCSTKRCNTNEILEEDQYHCTYYCTDSGSCSFGTDYVRYLQRAIAPLDEGHVC